MIEAATPATYALTLRKDGDSWNPGDHLTYGTITIQCLPEELDAIQEEILERIQKTDVLDESFDDDGTYIFFDVEEIVAATADVASAADTLIAYNRR